MAGGRGGGLGGRGNKSGSHRKGAQKGSGGKGRRALSGKGPTPAADKRHGHPAQRSAARRQRPDRTGTARAGAAPPGAARWGRDTTEVVAGRNAVVEALRAELPARSLHVAERIDADDRVRESLRMAADRGLPLLEAPRAELDRLTGGAIHQGLALQLPPYDYAAPDELLDVAAAAGEVPLVVALDGITDPRNLGAVVRSAGAFGGHGVVVPQRRSAGMTAGAWKASAGAAARVRVARAANLTRALESYGKAGLFVAGLAADADTTVGDLPFADAPMVLVVGAEGRGLSRLVRETCDATVGIPMRGAAESLNAGVAAGIALYEIARLRR
ncbi:MAG: 23S rRNA (guanosine(2251)-2'-O)-methyltransferase RlmB [Streptomycetales bacterium]